MRRFTKAIQVFSVFSTLLVFYPTSNLYAKDNSFKLNPGSESPSWGSDYMQVLNRVYTRVLDASGYVGPVDFNYIADSRYALESKEDGVVLALPVFSLGPNTDQNPTSVAKIVAGYNLFEMAHNEDELAFILAHEISHLVMEHPGKLEKNMFDKFNQWFRQFRTRPLEPDEYQQVQQVLFQLFLEQKIESLALFKQHIENEADREAMTLMVNAGYDPRAGAESLLHFDNFTRAIHGVDISETGIPAYDSPSGRAGKIRIYSRVLGFQ